MTDQTANDRRGHCRVTGRHQGSVTIAARNHARVVALEGEHDVSTADLVRTRLTDAHVAEAVVVDLTTTSFIDGSIASALYAAHRAEGPRIRFVVAPGTPPHRLFDLIGLDTVVPVYGRLEDALA